MVVVVVVVEWLAQSALGQKVLGSILAASKHFFKFVVLCKLGVSSL